MLKSLTSSDDRFKSGEFGPGVNLVLATKTAKSTSKASRNAVGKSSFVAVLDFLLGSDADKKHLLRRPELDDHVFEMVLAIGLEDIRVSRSGLDASNPRWNGVPISLSELRERLGSGLFGLNPPIANGLSYRLLLAFYLRKRENGGFDGPLKTFKRQTDLAVYPALAYLLGLASEVVERAQGIADSKKNISAVRKAAKDPLLAGSRDTVPQLEAEIATLKILASELGDRLEGFRVVDQYLVHQENADQWTREIRSLNDKLVLLVERERDLLVAADSGEAEATDDSYLPAVYAEVGVVFSDLVLRAFEDVRKFHDSVVSNRHAYLEDELHRVRIDRDEARAELAQLDAKRSDVMKLLAEGGALETFTALQVELSVSEGRIAELEERRGVAQRLVEASKVLKSEGIELERAAKLDLVERKDEIAQISELFTRLAFEIYGAERPAGLSIESDVTGYKILPTIGGESSAGVSSISVFCFDLTMAVISHRSGRGPDFLVHDSHLFDAVEERQVAAALLAASRVCAEERMQYIVTLNSDAFERAKQYADELDYRVAISLTDEYDGGGLFGFRFN